jgi:hypothetical protein
MYTIYHNKRIKFFVTDNVDDIESLGRRKVCFVFRDLDIDFEIAKECFMTIVSTESISEIGKRLQESYDDFFKPNKEFLRQFFILDEDFDLIDNVYDLVADYAVHDELPKFSRAGLVGFKVFLKAPLNTYLKGFGPMFENLTILDVIKDTKDDTMDYIKDNFKGVQNRFIMQLFV